MNPARSLRAGGQRGEPEAFRVMKMIGRNCEATNFGLRTLDRAWGTGLAVALPHFVCRTGADEL